jgi:hypothetical protein
MLSRTFTFQNNKGEEFDFNSEFAYVVASTYNLLGADKVIKARKTAWIVAFLIGVPSIILSVTASPFFLFLMVIPGVALFQGYSVKLAGNIESIKKVKWAAGFRDIEGTCVMVDKSGLFAPTTFSIPIPNDNPANVLRIADKINTLSQNRSVILPYQENVNETDVDSPYLNKLELELRDLLDDIAKAFDSNRVENVTLSALDNDSKIVIKTLEDSHKFVSGSYGYVIESSEAKNLDDRLMRLKKMTHLLNVDFGSKSIEEATDDLLRASKSQLSILEDIRRHSLMEILGPQLNKLASVYKLTTGKAICQSCYEAMQVNNDAQSQEIISAIGSENISTDKLSNIQKQIAYSQNILKSSVMTWSIKDQKFHCPLCHGISDSQYVVHTAKDELIFPLWDTLWMELSNERAELIREKERERRENLNAELVELDSFLKEFVEERRLIRTKLNDLKENSIVTAETLISMIKAFREYGILTDNCSNEYTSRVQQLNDANKSRLSEVLENLETAENDLRMEVDKTKNKRRPIIDPVDEVKIKDAVFALNEKFDTTGSHVEDIRRLTPPTADFAAIENTQVIDSRNSGEITIDQANSIQNISTQEVQLVDSGIGRINDFIVGNNPSFKEQYHVEPSLNTEQQGSNNLENNRDIIYAFLRQETPFEKERALAETELMAKTFSTQQFELLKRIYSWIKEYEPSEDALDLSKYLAVTLTGEQYIYFKEIFNWATGDTSGIFLEVSEAITLAKELAPYMSGPRLNLMKEMYLWIASDEKGPHLDIFEALETSRNLILNIDPEGFERLKTIYFSSTGYEDKELSFKRAIKSLGV